MHWRAFNIAQFGYIKRLLFKTILNKTLNNNNNIFLLKKYILCAASYLN